MNATRDAQPIENLMDLLGPAVIRAHDPDRLDRRDAHPGPLSEVLGDRGVELLVTWACRLGQHVVDHPERHGSRHRRSLVGSEAPFQQQHAASGAVHRPHAGEHLDAVRLLEDQIGEHHRHGTARGRDVGDSSDGLGPGRRDVQPVVPRVATHLVQQLRRLVGSRATMRITGSMVQVYSARADGRAWRGMTLSGRDALVMVAVAAADVPSCSWGSGRGRLRLDCLLPWLPVAVRTATTQV